MDLTVATAPNPTYVNGDAIILIPLLIFYFISNYLYSAYNYGNVLDKNLYYYRLSFPLKILI